jgi:hypothetical protein
VNSIRRERPRWPICLYHRGVRPWGLGAAGLLAAVLAGLLSAALLTVALPRPVTEPPPGPVLESVTPAQLASLNLRLEATVQPLQVPDRVTTALGFKPPATIVMRSDAEAAVRRNSGGVRSVMEVTLAYATLQTTGRQHFRGPTIVHRLVWAVVGSRAVSGAGAGVLQMLWLVDARSARQLTELAVPAALPAPGGGAAGPPGH